MGTDGLEIGLLIVCVALSSFFSATETSLTTLSHAKTRQLMESGGRSTRILSYWLNWPNRVLTTILIGNSLVNTLSAVLATVITEQIFDSYAIGIATGAATILLLIFGEITPKTVAKHNAVALAPVLLHILMPFYWVFYPVVVTFSWIAIRVVHLLGWKSTSVGPFTTSEDITFLIRLGHQEGVLKRDEGKLLESVIEFRDTLVKEAMVPRTEICSLEKQAMLPEILEAFAEDGHSRWPIYDDDIDHVVGVLHAKDILSVLIAQDKKDFSIETYMRPALFVPEMMKLSSLLKEFQHGKAHLAIVVDEYGGTSGIITLEDVLEELVGEIRDEHDDENEIALINKLSDELFVVDGRAHIDDVSDALSLEFPEDEYESLNGFLIATHGKLPHVGEHFDFGGWRFVIKNADEKKVLLVQIEKLPSATSERDTP